MQPAIARDPAVALSCAVAAVAGQNCGARSFPRLRATFIEGAKLNVGFMLLFTLICQPAGAARMRVFSNEDGVIQVGAG